MNIDFNKYRIRSYDRTPKQVKVLRIGEETKKCLDEMADKYELRLTALFNCAVDFGCQMMESDEDFRTYILSIPRKRKNISGGEKKVKIILRKDVEDNLKKTINNYRIFNENAFVYESVCKLIEKEKNDEL